MFSTVGISTVPVSSSADRSIHAEAGIRLQLFKPLRAEALMRRELN